MTGWMRRTWMLERLAGPWVLASIAAAVLAAGCAQNPMAMQGQVQSLRREQEGLAQKNTDLSSRAQLLDAEHQDLQSRLAQSVRQNRLMEEQVKALQDQLAGSADQIARLREEARSGSRGSLASTPTTVRPKASVRANNSLQGNLPKFDAPGVEVRFDGDVVRVELPGSQLFDSGDARLRPNAGPTIDEVAAEIARRFPEQMVGVEGHTDADPIAPNSHWPNNHQLSIGRATAVYEYLAQRTRLKAGQLFIVGHGSNHPVVSNATEPGKQRNRRVELVVYPETVAR